MSVYTVVGLCLITSVAVLLVGGMKRELVPTVIMGLGVTVFLLSMPWLSETVGFIRTLTEYADNTVASTVLRALGIAYLTSTAAELCKSCGEQSVVTYVETAGKLSILALAVPLFKELLNIAVLK